MPSDALLTAGSEGEVVVARARLGLTLGIALVPLAALLQSPRPENWISLGVVVAAMALAWLTYWAARRPIWTRWLGLTTSLTDVSMVTLAHALFIVGGAPTLAATSRTSFTLYAIAIAATTLRFDVRICMAAGALAVVQYAGIAAWAWVVWAPAPTPDTALYGRIEIGSQVGRLIVLVTMTWLAVAVVRQSARLRFASTHDQLTGLLNRSYFDERFREEVVRSARSGAPLAIAILDLDQFKQINDELGHGAGDGALRAVSEALRAAVRRSDIVARYGGDEFVMLFDGTSPADALDRLEKVRARVAAQSFDTRHGGHAVRVTLSAGLAVFPADGAEPDELLHAADTRLLAAKRAGRNTVVHPAAR